MVGSDRLNVPAIDNSSRVEFRRPWPPLQAPCLRLHGDQEGRAGGN